MGSLTGTFAWMAKARDDLDPTAVGLFAYQVFSNMQGAVTSGMVHLGDKLGLYRALADSPAPQSTTELAEATGLDERWVREWAYNQGAAGLVKVDEDERLSLSPEAVAVLADPDHESFGAGPFHHLPQTMAALERLPGSFRSGIGLDYDAHGRECAEGVARGFEPWMRNHLVPTVLPKLDGVVEAAREPGAQVADVGCGAGGAVFMLAAAYPASRIRGYDISQEALDLARTRQAEAGIDNAEFLDPRSSPLPDDGSVDFVTTFDCLHDMTDPAGVVRAIRAALADDGTWLLVDIKAHDRYAENAEHPLAAMMYGISVLSCMSSGLSEPGGAGLGTLGLTASRAEAMARDAGFTRFRVLDIDHPINAFYEIRP